MIAVDTNLLVYSHREDSQFHPVAKAAVEGLRQQAASWAVPWPCVHEFISVTTNPNIYRPASTLTQSLGFLEALMASPGLHLLSEGPGYFAKLSELALSVQLKGARIHDARIAVLCLHHGVRELWTADRDFSRFPQLKTRNPLAAR